MIGPKTSAIYCKDRIQKKAFAPQKPKKNEFFWLKSAPENLEHDRSWNGRGVNARIR